MRFNRLHLAILIVIAATVACSREEKTAEETETAVVTEQASLPGQQVNEEERPPNILLIVADDMGYTDLGSFGGEIRTPNLDKLAYEGVRLSNFHVHPSCAPTRAALMSGTLPHRAGVGTQLVTIERFRGDPHVEKRRGKRGYEGHLNDNVATIPEILQDSGYRTYMAGKWHLGKKPEHSPAARGFDRSFELIHGSGSHFPNISIKNFREDGVPLKELPDDFYSTRYFTDKVISYIDEDREEGKPWLAYMAYTAPHWPLQVEDAWLDKYADEYDNGYDELRTKRIEHALAKGVINLKAAEKAAPSFARPWPELDEAERQHYRRSMEIYAAMVENLDFHVGRMIEYLEQAGELDNTIIIFMSDNGAENFEMEFAKRAPRKPKVVNNAIENYGREDSFILYGLGWAQAGMGPFGYHKGTLAEGGIRAAAFVNHNSLVNQGGVDDTFLTVQDLSATILNAAGAQHPGTEYKGRQVAPLEGDSFLPLLTVADHKMDRDDRVFLWEHDGQVVLRRGDWKFERLKSPHGPKQAFSGWHLYNLADDPSETTDISSEYPEIVAQFEASWDEIVSSGDLIPYPPN